MKFHLHLQSFFFNNLAKNTTSWGETKWVCVNVVFLRVWTLTTFNYIHLRGSVENAGSWASPQLLWNENCRSRLVKLHFVSQVILVYSNSYIGWCYLFSGYLFTGYLSSGKKIQQRPASDLHTWHRIPFRGWRFFFFFFFPKRRGVGWAGRGGAGRRWAGRGGAGKNSPGLGWEGQGGRALALSGGRWRVNGSALRHCPLNWNKKQLPVGVTRPGAGDLTGEGAYPKPWTVWVRNFVKWCVRIHQAPRRRICLRKREGRADSRGAAGREAEEQQRQNSLQFGEGFFAGETTRVLPPERTPWRGVSGPAMSA